MSVSAIDLTSIQSNHPFCYGFIKQALDNGACTGDLVDLIKRSAVDPAVAEEWESLFKQSQLPELAPAPRTPPPVEPLDLQGILKKLPAGGTAAPELSLAAPPTQSPAAKPNVAPINLTSPVDVAAALPSATAVMPAPFARAIARGAAARVGATSSIAKPNLGELLYISKLPEVKRPFAGTLSEEQIKQLSPQQYEAWVADNTARAIAAGGKARRPVVSATPEEEYTPPKGLRRLVDPKFMGRYLSKLPGRITGGLEETVLGRQLGEQRPLAPGEPGSSYPETETTFAERMQRRDEALTNFALLGVRPSISTADGATLIRPKIKPVGTAATAGTRDLGGFAKLTGAEPIVTPPPPAAGWWQTMKGLPGQSLKPIAKDIAHTPLDWWRGTATKRELIPWAVSRMEPSRLVTNDLIPYLSRLPSMPAAAQPALKLLQGGLNTAAFPLRAYTGSGVAHSLVGGGSPLSKALAIPAYMTAQQVALANLERPAVEGQEPGAPLERGAPHPAGPAAYLPHTSISTQPMFFGSLLGDLRRGELPKRLSEIYSPYGKVIPTATAVAEKAIPEIVNTAEGIAQMGGGESPVTVDSWRKTTGALAEINAQVDKLTASGKEVPLDMRLEQRYLQFTKDNPAGNKEQFREYLKANYPEEAAKLQPATLPVPAPAGGASAVQQTPAPELTEEDVQTALGIRPPNEPIKSGPPSSEAAAAAKLPPPSPAAAGLAKGEGRELVPAPRQLAPAVPTAAPAAAPTVAPAAVPTPFQNYHQVLSKAQSLLAQNKHPVTGEPIPPEIAAQKQRLFTDYIPRLQAAQETLPATMQADGVASPKDLVKQFMDPTGKTPAQVRGVENIWKSPEFRSNPEFANLDPQKQYGVALNIWQRLPDNYKLLVYAGAGLGLIGFLSSLFGGGDDDDGGGGPMSYFSPLMTLGGAGLAGYGLTGGHPSLVTKPHFWAGANPFGS